RPAPAHPRPDRRERPLPPHRAPDRRPRNRRPPHRPAHIPQRPPHAPRRGRPPLPGGARDRLFPAAPVKEGDMLNVKHIPSDQATGRLREFYDRMRTTIRGAIGRDFQGDQKLFLASSLQLEVMESWLAHRQICVEQLGIEPREYELILMRVMY